MFGGDLLLRNVLPREYCENKSLAHLNRFTVGRATDQAFNLG